MVEGMLALVATSAALVGAGLLVQSALKERRAHLAVWSAGLVLMGLSLAAMALGSFAGFTPFAFRVMALTGGLLAPLCAAVGLIELVARPVQVRFAARLVGISYGLVALVVLILDPLSTAKQDLGVPNPGDAYGVLPTALLTGATGLSVLTLLGGLTTAVVRTQKRDKSAYALMLPAGLAAVAGMINVIAVGWMPGLLKIVGLAAAAGLIFFAASNTTTAEPDEDDEDDESGEAEQEAEDEMAYEPPYEHPHRPHQPPRQNTQGMRRPEPPQPPPPPGRHTGQRPLPPQPPAGPPTQAMPPMQSTGPLAPDDWFASPPPPPQQPPAGPYGQIVVYTLLDGREQAFDRQVNQLIGEAVRAEEGILIFTCHEVEGAPTQRISYQLFRDRAAYNAHQGRPYVHRFHGESRTHVLATNVIDLKLTGGSLPVLR
ncbi:antibiotic biosynthesis monooxygenase [Actinocorallia sp. API 0066]|uniref:putative quinol monooxygenase n=1 Tax=Actinocorallia sp. API 0066 TaxID=2896846 RepID=UPI001E56FA00|nr:antibiotic biosynthesis monooxygenase family protein [Actinocorallia sp. API 0066]MCD0452243.1 antibiotic biosynthesis monooxygenase [Actinocorallia sp. API 0066]